MFDYDGLLVKMLEKAGNMMIVSFLWLLTCIPVITIIPATAALCHTTSKVIRQRGRGVVNDYFKSFVASLKKGIALSIICVIFGLLLYTALDFGRQVWQQSLIGALYYAFGFFLAFIFLTMLLFIPPTLSRFETSVAVTLRLSLFLASRNLLRTIWHLVLLAFMILLVYIYPLLILILPGLYADLICGGTEKTLQKFMVERGLEESSQSSEASRTDEYTDDASERSEDEHAGMTSLELDMLLDDGDEEFLNTGDTDE